LSVTYKGKNIAHVLEMEIREALRFFSEEKALAKQLQVFEELGLGYLTLGQSATTLSGGEAQRLKLAAFLMKATHKHTLFLFDEPATGLHAYDIHIFLRAINGLLQSGHTVVMAEHQRPIIEAAHHLIELGPEGGDKGGYCLFSGKPDDLKHLKNSPTAQWLWEPQKTTEAHSERSFPRHIQLKGVNTHNLKNISVTIPHQQLSVITGVSGSGKSSLAFDTLFAEGQRNFTSHFSAYARTLLRQIARPHLESATGLTPPIAISGHSLTRNPRATVGTISGIWDSLRLLFSRIANETNKAQLITSSHFSFNHEAGMCPVCHGLGMRMQANASAFLSNAAKPLMEGAMHGHKVLKALTDPYSQEMAILKTVARVADWDLTIPWEDLPEKIKETILFGSGNKNYAVTWHFKRKNRKGTHSFESTWPGLVHYVNKAYQAKLANGKERELSSLMQEVACETCRGSRLKRESRRLKVGNWHVEALQHTEIKELQTRLSSMEPHVNTMGKKLLAEVLKEITPKVQGLLDLGLGYLTLNRDSRTLSGGEGRRLRLVSQLGGELQRVTYVMDEPTIGLHPSDISGLVKWMKDLAKTNTVVVVEHDTEVMAAADHLIELGPGSGEQGGEVLFAGSYGELVNSTKAITTPYLNSSFRTSKPAASPAKGLTLIKAKANNLKNIDLTLIRNGICVFQGVSGSGKSSLLQDVIYASARAGKAVSCESISGIEHFHQVVLLDQRSVSSAKSSMPLTYLGLFDAIRKAFASGKAAKEAGLTAGDFSLNTKGGRCETCKGEGALKTAMDFLADVWVPCPDCHGRRFEERILQVKVDGLTIADVLETSIAELHVLWAGNPIAKALELLCNLGLGHLKAGQSLRTLSGGEAQRLKLAKVLLQKHQKPTLFLLDEPTTGLHVKDIEQLIEVFSSVLKQGHTLYIIEHHPALVQLAHQVVTLGPAGGDAGGYLL
jgi:excinuclease ABC subunit A